VHTDRLAFLLLTPVLIVRLAKNNIHGSLPIRTSDLFLVLTGFWMIYGPANADGLTSSLNHAGSEVLEFCIGFTVDLWGTSWILTGLFRRRHL
jgi:hypothetical protein